MPRPRTNVRHQVVGVQSSPMSSFDPYSETQAPFRALYAALRARGQLRPAKDCVLLIKKFYEDWDVAKYGDINDAIAVFASRSNVGFKAGNQSIALVRALVGGDSSRLARTASEWGRALTTLAPLTEKYAAEAVDLAGGIDPLSRHGKVSPRLRSYSAAERRSRAADATSSTKSRQ